MNTHLLTHGIMILTRSLYKHSRDDVRLYDDFPIMLETLRQRRNVHMLYAIKKHEDINSIIEGCYQIGSNNGEC